MVDENGEIIEKSDSKVSSELYKKFKHYYLK
jgi:hypothetical protein